MPQKKENEINGLCNVNVIMSLLNAVRQNKRPCTVYISNRLLCVFVFKELFG